MIARASLRLLRARAAGAVARRGARAQAVRQLPDAGRRRRDDQRPVGHRAARSRFRARPRRATRTARITWGEVKAKHARHRSLRAVAADARARAPRHVAPVVTRAADRRPQRRRVRGAALHRALRRGAADARRRLPAVRRRRSAASRPRSSCRPAARRARASSAPTRRRSSLRAGRRRRQSTQFVEYLQRRRRCTSGRASITSCSCCRCCCPPCSSVRAFPAQAWTARAELPRRVLGRVQGRDGLHRRAFDHAVARGARRRSACRRASSNRRSPRPSCWRRSTTCGRVVYGGRWMHRVRLRTDPRLRLRERARRPGPAAGLAAAGARRVQSRRRAGTARDRCGVPADCLCAARHLALPAASSSSAARSLVAALAALWLAERAFDTTLLPALKFGT